MAESTTFDAWQIGSKSPPKNCLCCGEPFSEIRTIRGPYLNSPYIWVCNQCWLLPFLFFPDKPAEKLDGIHEIMFHLNRPKKLYQLAATNISWSNIRQFATEKRVAIFISANRVDPQPVKPLSDTNPIEISAIRFEQKGIPLYLGVMKAADILAVYSINQWAENNLDGYQRELYRERKEQMWEYIRDCPIAMVPTIFAGLGGDFTYNPSKGNVGTLRIAHNSNSVSLIDGQHRMGGFLEAAEEAQRLEREKAKRKLTEAEEEALKRCYKTLEYTVPVLFVDTASASGKVQKEMDPAVEAKAGPADVERTLFFIINKTQKGINPSLKDTLAYQIASAGIKGIPIIEREPWRVDAARTVHILNNEAGSPLEGNVNLGGVRGLKRPVRLNSFVTSLEPLFKDNKMFEKLDHDAQKDFLKAYWSVIHELFPDAFTYASDFLILKTIGVYALNWLADDVFNWITVEGKELNTENIQLYLENLKDFNWSKEDSPLKPFGGLAGVNAAYEYLLEHMSKRGIKEAKKRLSDIRTKKEKKAIPTEELVKLA